MYYTCKFSAGHKVYPLINVGGPWVMGAVTQILEVTIFHKIVGGVNIEYLCNDGVIYHNEDNLFGNEIDARVELRKRNSVR